MTSIRLDRWAALLFCLPLGSALAQPDANTNVVEEHATSENGKEKVCGEGDGMAACRDANGLAYAEEVRSPGMEDESDDKRAAAAPRMRAESLAQLNKTIGEIETGYNPDDRAIEGLPH